MSRPCGATSDESVSMGIDQGRYDSEEETDYTYPPLRDLCGHLERSRWVLPTSDTFRIGRKVDLGGEGKNKQI